MNTNNTGHIYVSQLVGSMGGADMNKVRYFRQPIDNYPNGIMPTVRLGKTSDEIHTNLIPLPFGDPKGLK